MQIATLTVSYTHEHKYTKIHTTFWRTICSIFWKSCPPTRPLIKEKVRNWKRNIKLMPRNIYVVPGLWMILLYVRLENFQFLNLNSEPFFRIPHLFLISLPLLAKFFHQKEAKLFLYFCPYLNTNKQHEKKENVHQFGDSKKTTKWEE